ncbi:uncharacterized protein A4U43_C07F38210 [Asparagus officinalis]|uniref:Uncharacterized protein n=1 Tax=Asparagus officinalis TaxID=4686 RepID=A0A5P1EI45_ASPOF|nr:uncharacterized protein A4U43_C07F38210 [Asparagus officinalis]
MPPPKDLPGLYFDPEKNRYFPIKGPIPGLKRPSRSPAESSDGKKKAHTKKTRPRNRMRPLELLQFRELLGASITSNRRRYKFKQEFEKLQASSPRVWRYPRTAGVADSALEQMYGILQTSKGLKETCLLATGGVNGYISLHEVGNLGQCFASPSMCTPEPVWPKEAELEACNRTAVGSIWSPPEASTSFSSSISCIRRIGRHYPCLPDVVSSFQRSSALRLHRRALKVNSFDCTIWTTDCSWDGTRAVIGTNLGAALINLETRSSSWVYKTKSDVFSQQFDHSGNVVLCGFRNGAIVEVDVREKQSRPSEASSSIQRKKCSSNRTFMSSSVCSLVALQSDDRYFLGSSMDGSIKLFDRHLLQRGAIQSYEGHVNSHSHLQLGVNPSETLMISGGEDQYVRIWSIKTSELIFEENVSNSILSTVCWPQGIYSDENPFEQNYSWGAWLGSREGLFYMHGT